MREWLAIALQRNVILRGVKVGAVVGTVLVAINQGDQILVGDLPPEVFWKIPLTYLVPFCVSIYVGVSSALSHREEIALLIRHSSDK